MSIILPKKPHCQQVSKHFQVLSAEAFQSRSLIGPRLPFTSAARLASAVFFRLFGVSVIKSYLDWVAGIPRWNVTGDF
jgi:hypothetical protein